MAEPLRAGLVGCGSVAQRGILPHLSLPDARQRVRLVAVADADAARARASAERFGVARAFDSLDAMLAGAELDLVLVATPIPFHYANALAAIEAGKHVYVQKAMTASVAEANGLLQARDRQGVRLAAAPGFELFPSTGQMRAVIAGGDLGRIYQAYTYTLGFGHEREPIRAGDGALAAIDPSWYYRAGGGPLPDVTVYALQLATSVLGPVRRVSALASRVRPRRQWRDRTIDIEVEDNSLVLLEFAEGALGMAAGADCAGSPRLPWGGLGVYGQHGSLEVLEVDSASGYPTLFETHTAAGARQHACPLSEQPYLRGDHLALEEPHVYADIMDLADAIRDDRPPRATGEQARHVVEIIERAQAAARTGSAQSLTTTF